MRQLVQNPRSGAVEVVELPDPVPGRNEVLVRNSWSLISPGTEQAVSSTAGKSLIGKARDRPDQARRVVEKALSDGVGPTLAAVQARLDDLLTPGYSSAGVVEAVGGGVPGIRVGDSVGCVGANAACHAERVVVPGPLVFALPADLDRRWGAFGALGGIAAHGVRLTEVDAGSVIVVIGLGLVGQLAAQLATAAGARVIAVDVSAERVELGRALGAVEGAQSGDDDVEAVVREISGGHGADGVILAAATKESGPIELAAGIARDRAIVTAVGDVGLSVPRTPFYEKELQLRISRSYGPGRYDPAYEQEGRDYPIGYVRWTERRLITYFYEEVAAGRIRLEPLVSHELPIERAGEAYELLSERSRMAMLLRYDGSPEVARFRRKEVVGSPNARGRPRVALIGPGLFARSTLLPELAKRKVELAGIAGRSPARAFGIARRWKAGFAASDAAEILDDESVDVVVIATRHDSHAELAAQALEKGKAVFLEKPLAIDRPGLDRLKPLLEAGGRLVVDFNRGFAPATEETMGGFADRAGPLYVGYRVNAGRLEPDHWLRDPARGGGRLVGEGCHFVDFVSGVVGRPLVSLRVATVGSGVGATDDSFVLTLSYEDGSVGSIAYLDAGHPRLSKERVEIIGDGRSATILDFRRVALHPDPRALRSRMPHTQDKGHGSIIDAALRFFANGGEPPIPYERLIETTAATLLAREALAVGGSEPLPVRGL